jgi:hypothetical protein
MIPRFLLLVVCDNFDSVSFFQTCFTLCKNLMMYGSVTSSYTEDLRLTLNLVFL